MAKAGTDPAAVSLPAGTGAVAGLGESFTLDLNTGQGNYTVPLPLPQGVAAFTPHVKLEYASAYGHGPFGLGWRLPLREITRRLDLGIPGGPAEGSVAPPEDERFLDSGRELLPLADGTYAPGVESGFQRYQRSGEGWVIEEKGGVRHELGRSAAARVADPDRPGRIHSWLLERSLDPSGNEIRYRHHMEAGTPYLAEVRYATYALRLSYESRPDGRLNGRAGFLRRLALRCSRLELFLVGEGEGADRLLRSWTLDYTEAPLSGVSLLAAIRLRGQGAAADGSADVAKNPITFQYTAFQPDRLRVRWLAPPSQGGPPPLTDPDVALCTLDSAPLPGVLQVVGGRHVYWPNRGDGRWGEPLRLRDTPHVSALGRAGVQLLDLDGNGSPDLLVAAGAGRLHGYYENAGGRAWSRFVHYPRGSAEPPWTSGRLRLADLDGDGRIDALYTGSRAFATYTNLAADGWAEPRLAPMGRGEDGPDVDFADPLVRLADMTGDGLLDVVRIGSGRIEYWPSLGHGRFGPRVVMAGSPRLPISQAPDAVLLLDVDGDGCSDLVRVSAHGVEVYVNRSGAAFAPAVRHAIIPAPLPGTLRAADMAGQGRPGLVWNSIRGREVGYVHCQLGLESAPYLLSGIDHGSGLFSEIAYRSAVEDALRDRDRGEAWETYLPFPVQVVAATEETDRITGRVSRTRYHYHHGHFDPRTRQFQGFGRVEKVEEGDDSRPDTLTAYHFLMGQDRLPGRGPEHAVLNRLLHRSEVYGLDGSPLQNRAYQVEESEHGFTVLDTLPDGRQRVFVYVERTRTRYTDRSDDERVEERAYTYDSAGNVTEEQYRAYGRRDGSTQPEDRLVTRVTHAQHPLLGLTDRIARIVKRDGSGRLLGEVRRYYDGPDFTGLPLGEVERGLLTREERLVLPDAAFAVHYAGLDAAALGYHRDSDVDGAPGWFVPRQRGAYDARGLKVAEMDPLGNVTRLGYDGAGLFRTVRSDFLGTSTLAYDPAVGQPVAIGDPDGTAVGLRYDALGRLVAVALPGDTLEHPTRVYVYNDAAIPGAMHVYYRLAQGTPQMLHTVTYYDGAGRELQKRVGMEAGRVIVSGWLEKNPFGQTRAEYEPTFAPDFAFGIPALAGRPRRRCFFDALGRPVRTVNYGGGESSVDYAPFVLTLADANDNDASPANTARGQAGTPRREEYDVSHRRTAVVDTGPAGPEATRYELGPLGELLAYQDGSGEVARHTFDLVGNRLTIRHREAGERRLWYDAAQRVVRTVDGRGDDVRARHDAAGRLLQVVLNGTVVEEYSYDAPGPGGWGRLAVVRYEGGRQSFTYNRRGQVQDHTYEVDGQTGPFTLSYQYDGLGKESRVTLPGGVSVEREHYDNGLLRRIPGYIDAMEYDARALPVRVRYANGVTTELQYVPGVGQVEGQRTLGPGGERYADLRYDFDQAGLLLQSADLTPGGELRAFQYDPLYQLTAVTAGAAVQRYEYAHGAHPYSLTYLGESDTHLIHGDAARPGLLTGLRRGAAPAFAIPYDGNGNLAALPGRRFRFNFKNELVGVDREDGTIAEYRYDHQGQLVLKRVQQGSLSHETVLLGDQVEIRDGQMAFYVLVGRSRVALVAGGRTRFIHSDYLGSSTFFSDERGMRIAAIAYHPFGNSAAPAAGGGTGAGVAGDPGPRIFALHPYDVDAGLYRMGRRYYAPEVGRFISPDPVYLYDPERGAGDPRTLALYTYVANDPLNKVDPTGTSFWSVVGAIAGAIVGVAVAVLVVAAFASGIGFGLLAVAGVIALVTVSYVVASNATAGSGFAEFMRGFLIGLNAGMNAVFATVIFGALLGPAGVGIGIGLGVLNFLAAFDTVAQNEVYQGILGWSNLIMPMSWLVTGLGLAFFVLNLLGHVVTFGQVDFFKVTDVSVDWKTGTFFTKGGWIANANPIDTGFNMGNFAFIDRNNTTPMADIREHEAGHTLNLAAFGSIFHFVGAIEENATSAGANAYAELLAESNVPGGRGRRTIPMWG